MTDQLAHPPGWYPDPGGAQAAVRWWDGSRWTDQFATRRHWHDTRTLRPWLVGSLGLTVLSEAAYAGASLFRRSLLGGDPAAVPVDRAKLADLLVAACAFVSVGATLLTVVLWLVWFHRTYRNAETIHGVRHRGWSVWGWLVPVMSLFRPLQMANDAWAAGDPGPRRAPHGTPLLGMWWTALLLGFLLERASAGQDRNAASETDPVEMFRLLREADTTAAVASALLVVAGLLAIQVVRRLSARLDDRARTDGLLSG